MRNEAVLAKKPCPLKTAMLIFIAISRKSGSILSTSVVQGALALSGL